MTLKKTTFIFLFCIAFVSVYSQPAVISFNPEFGPVGTIVTIKGNNFDTNGNNLVYFGAVKAAIVNYTDTALQVIVPTGATYEPITVVTNQLTAYSTKPFTITFPGARNSFLPGLFTE